MPKVNEFIADQPLLDVHKRSAGGATELYITARPHQAGNTESQAGALMAAVAGVLSEHKAAIIQERIFAAPAAMDTLSQARRGAFNGLCDGVEPTYLCVPAGDCGPISGIQVHAVCGCRKPEVVTLDDQALGRLFTCGGRSYLGGCNIQADAAGSPAAQAREMLEKAEALLARAGGRLSNVARTWMWLQDILDWYGEFNTVRNELFLSRGLLRADAGGNMPASTGIGIGPAGRNTCAMDFIAVLGNQRPEFLLAASKQGAASKYGSAFSRAAIMPTPAGKTIYVSGTAAIDASGATTHLDDARGQIADTLANVYAVLADAGSGKEDIVQAIVYCKTPQVEQVFRQEFGDVPFPHVVAIADVCRSNLLFEVEATAMSRQ